MALSPPCCSLSISGSLSFYNNSLPASQGSIQNLSRSFPRLLLPPCSSHCAIATGGARQAIQSQKYDARRVLQKFGETVRDETDLENLTNELVNVIQETMQPKSVNVWLLKSKDRRGATE